MKFDFVNEKVYDSSGTEIGYLHQTESGMHYRVFLYSESGPPIHWGIA